MAGMHISRKLKGGVLGEYISVTAACLRGLETISLSENQQQKLQPVQVCGNNWVRRIAG